MLALALTQSIEWVCCGIPAGRYYKGDETAQKNHYTPREFGRKNSHYANAHASSLPGYHTSPHETFKLLNAGTISTHNLYDAQAPSPALSNTQTSSSALLMLTSPLALRQWHELWVVHIRDCDTTTSISKILQSLVIMLAMNSPRRPRAVLKMI